MDTVEDIVKQFVDGVKNGKWKKVRVPKKDLPEFLILLARSGFKIGLECLEQIDNPFVRSQVKNIILSCAGGAIIGASVGTLVTGGNPAGAKVGAAAGAAVGLLAVATAISISPDDDPGPQYVTLTAT